MQVKQVMTKNPTYLEPTATLKEASLQMSEWHCGFIPIGENDRLIGVVTDRDITIRATAKGRDPKTQLKEIMTKDIQFCYEEDDITLAAKRMTDKHVHRLIVLNKGKRFTGIISLSDIATKTHDTKLCGQLLESLSQYTEETTH